MPFVRAIAVGLAMAGFLLVGAPWSRALAAVGRREGSFLSIWFCRLLCALLRIRRRETGAGLTPGRPVLIVANHVSWTDVLVLGAERRLCFVAKKEVAAWPALGTLARAQGCVFLDRGRRMLIPHANAQIAARLLAGIPVVLFAEATTGDGTRVRKFHSSHLAAPLEALRREPGLAYVEIRPVSIVYRNRSGLPLGRLGRSTVAWYGDMTFLPSLWALLRSGPVECELAYGAAIEFGRDQDRKTITRRLEACVRGLVASSLSGPPPRRDPLATAAVSMAAVRAERS